MSLQLGTRLGPYEITAPIGVGGMGEVYRAKDTKLGRDVAIKVLPESVATDPERLARFHREAQVLASLNHPHIAAIYGFEDSNSTHGLVMELVDGPTLADRIARGPIPLDEALPIAKQIADALETAHEQGIIHRDLKPANIKVRDDGTVKVLDFGLAKMMDPASGSGLQAPVNITASPTITTPAMMTGVGVILGTAAYMSPEQAKGRPVDRRTDIWAFGCLLYEMLSGRRAFEGEDIVETLGKVVTAEPEWRALPGNTPRHVGELLRRMLRKDRRMRLDSAAAVRIELADETAMNAASDATGGLLARSSRLGWSVAAALGIVALVAVGAAVGGLRRDLPPAPLGRFTVAPPEGMAFAGSSRGVVNLALSPNGRWLAFIAAAQGKSSLWVRALDDPTPKRIAGSDGAIFPFWSPDSAAIGFFADEKLKTVQLSGGQPITVADARRPLGGSWGRDGFIVYSSLFQDGQFNGVRRVAASGGQPMPIPLAGGGSFINTWPVLLPDGRHFLHLHYRSGDPGQAEVTVSSLDGHDSSALISGDSASIAYGAGRLFYWRGNNLFAQTFDERRLQLTGEPMQLVSDIARDTTSGTRYAPFSVSEAGVLAYLQGDAQASSSQLVWLDRQGRTLENIGEPGNYAGAVSISGDGQKIAVSLTTGSPGNRDIWIIDAARGVRSRLTTYPGIDAAPVWSPDGRRVAFNSTSGPGLFVQNADGIGTAELLLKIPGQGGATDWSSDGRFIIYANLSADRARDLWIAPVNKSAKPIPFHQTPYNERAGMFSPDVRWIAYSSDESGRAEVYVEPYPATGSRTQVSVDGGGQPLWRDDGRELYYAAPNGTVMALAVTPGPQLGLGRPQALFDAGLDDSSVTRGYAASADGQRFLVLAPTKATAPLTVVVNWDSAKGK